jgi:protein SCO1/2
MLWGGIVLGLAIVTVALWYGGFPTGKGEDGLQFFGQVPDFVLVERSGRQVTKNSFLGKVWVVDFIFTRCADECPLLTGRMARLQQAFAAVDEVRFVSITIDPAYDTPEMLAQYARNFGADPQRWFFLTGDKKTIYRLAQEGFHLGVVDPSDARSTSAVSVFSRARRIVRLPLEVLKPRRAWAHHTEDGALRAIRHSARFVLVDRQGWIRGYYDGREDSAVRRLRRHVELLLQEHEG